MKRLIIFAFITLYIFSAYAREMVHAYFGNYVEIVRVVLVIRSEIHYNTLMDTDNRVIHIHMNDTRLDPSILPIDFDTTPLISHISYETIGRDLRVSIYTNVIYYAETFFHQEENFKIVLDIYRQREPQTLAQALEYLNFYWTVGFHDRAVRLQRRIDNGEFREFVHMPVETNRNLHTTQQLPPISTPQVVNTTPEPLFQNIELPSTFRTVNVMLYMRPDVNSLNLTLQNWVNEAFRVYDMFTNLSTNLDLVERTLKLYDTQSILDMTFVEAMSMSSNILSDANIRINEIRLLLTNSWNRKPQSNVLPVKYTEEMVQHVLSILNSYHERVFNLQTEYELRIRGI